MSDDKWKGEVVDTGMPTGEEMREAIENVAKNQRETWSQERSAPVHPLQYRDMLVVHSGYSKEKANKITLDLAKQQPHYSGEDIEKLEKALEA